MSGWVLLMVLVLAVSVIFAIVNAIRGPSCSDQLEDLNKDRQYPIDPAVCERDDWESYLEDLRDSGREYGWYR